MKNRLFFLVCLLAAITAFGCAPKSTTDNSHARMDHNGADHGNMGHSGMQSSANAADAPYDLQFLDTMTAHHQGAIEMAGPCAAKAQHAEIKTLCANIISSQQQEIADMKAWRDEWFPGAAPAVNMQMAGMNDSMKGMDKQKLGGSSGNDFDLEFIGQMTAHHEGAIIMANEAMQKSSKEEIKTLARAIVKAQEEEIKQMKEWQAAWGR